MNQDVTVYSWAIGSGLLVAALGIGLYGIVNSAQGDDIAVGYGASVEQVEHYKENCGDCHFAYPPNLLPQASWRLLMFDLANHFGEDAELEAEDTTLVTDYLLMNSTASMWRFAHQEEGVIPLRITRLNYFIFIHDEIPERLVLVNDEVGSFSNCSACHEETGNKRFDDDAVIIPGHGPWND